VGSGIITFLIFWPLAAAGIVLLIRSDRRGAIRGFALAATLAEFAASLYLLFAFHPGGGYQFTVRWVWSPTLSVGYQVGIDGISLFLVLLTTFLTAISVWSSFTAIKKRIKGYFVAFLVLEAGMVGTFCATDLFLFYVFWELMLLPMYFLIGIWGGKNRVYATMKFVLYTVAGSLFMLVAIIYTAYLIHRTSGIWTFDLVVWSRFDIPAAKQMWLFIAFALAFAIKVPIFPLHTWLPDAHVEAPTAASIILAGVLLKMGTYGFLRFAIPLFPAAFLEAVPFLVVLSVIGILYGALVAMVQKDVKSLVAYSSVAHLGFVMLGMCALNTIGFSGSLLQQLNHGISTGALFLLVGILYERRHTRLIADYGGLFKIVPVYSVFFMIIMLSSIGLPGTNGFVGEFLILLGAFRSQTAAAVLGTFGIVLAAGYMLWMFQRIFFGKVTNPENEKVSDLTLRERATLVPLVVLVFFIGLYPKPILERIEPALDRVLERVHKVQVVRNNEDHLPLALRQMGKGCPKSHRACGPRQEHRAPDPLDCALRAQGPICHSRAGGNPLDPLGQMGTSVAHKIGSVNRPAAKGPIP